MNTTTCYLCKGTGRLGLTPARKRILGALSRVEWRTAEAVADELELETSHVATMLRDMLRLGLVQQQGKGVRGSPYEWGLT